jgi:hypothetical protein
LAFFSKKNTTPRYFRDMKARVLSFVFFLLALAAHAQPSPYFGFQDAMPLRRGEAQWLTSGFFNHARVGVGRYVDVGFGLPFTTLVRIDEDQKRPDWNLSITFGGFVAPRWHLSSSFFRAAHYSGYADDDPEVYRTWIVRLAHGTRLNHVGLQLGGFRTQLWGHYIFSRELFGDSGVLSSGESNAETRGFVGLSALGTIGRVSGRLEVSYFRLRPYDFFFAPSQYVMYDAGISFNLRWCRLELGSTVIFRQLPSTPFSNPGLEAMPCFNWVLPLTRRTRRLWREDVALD